MRTRIVDPAKPDPAAIREAASVLRAGGLVAFPTETVYGLGARVFDEGALARVFLAKGRPTSHPLIAHVAREADAVALAAAWPERAARLARAFWPGPLTLVVDRAPSVPEAVSGGSPSIAVRAPAHPVARALLEALGEAIAAPSANRYQTLSPTTAEHVQRSLEGKVDLLLDGGPCPSGIESTVLDVRGEVARLVRLGALDLPTLRRVEPHIDVATAAPAAGEARPSPGMDPRHYAPRADLSIATRRADAIAEARAHLTAGADTGAGPRRVGLLLRGGLDAPESAGGLVVRSLGDDPVLYARDLYATLHAFDADFVDVIVVEAVPGDERWAAVADRLQRGAHRR